MQPFHSTNTGRQACWRRRIQAWPPQRRLIVVLFYVDGGSFHRKLRREGPNSTSSAVIPVVFPPSTTHPDLLLPSEKGPTVGDPSASPVIPYVSSSSPTAWDFGVNKTSSVFFKPAGNNGKVELVDATGPTTLSSFSASAGIAWDYLGVSGCGGIWDGSMVSVSTISFGVRIPL
jgi:hypothetical protein